MRLELRIMDRRSPARLTAIVLALGLAACGRGEQAAPGGSMAYVGHEGERDTPVLAAAYPGLIGTRLDDCQTCHRGGEVVRAGGKRVMLSPCNFCHLVPFPDERIVEGAPEDFAATLNAFGRDYLDAGRDGAALAAIAERDSDGDGAANGAEIAALRYPGDPGSRPGQAQAPVCTFSRGDLEKLPRHEQVVLMNSHTQAMDEYVHYRGVRLIDLLIAAGADLDRATSITLIAPDGFAWDLSVEQAREAFPPGRFFGDLGPEGFADPKQGFVRYPPEALLPETAADGGEIPGEAWAMIADGRNGAALSVGHLDPERGSLEGEGPFRGVVPQSRPGAPDRGSSISPSGYGDGHDYDDEKDHNAGACTRGLVAVRVNPLPEGTEEFDWKNGGWALIERGELIVYGAGITEP
jgi:hypothetical protein